MPTINDAQDAVNTGAASLGAGVPSINVRHDPPRLSILSNLSGGIGPTRTTRFRPNVSVNADLETVCLTLHVNVFLLLTSGNPSEV